MLSQEGAAPGRRFLFRTGIPDKNDMAYAYIDSVGLQKVDDFLILAHGLKIERLGRVCGLTSGRAASELLCHVFSGA
jgi:hypothetical protein